MVVLIAAFDMFLDSRGSLIELYAQFLRRDICSGSGGRLLRISFRNDEFSDMFT